MLSGLAPSPASRCSRVIECLRIRQWKVLAFLSFLTVALFVPQTVFAQEGSSLRIPPVVLPDESEIEIEDETLEAAAATKWVIDTDPGVDDAAALVWLFSQNHRAIDVLGLVTVAGNTTVDNATRNLVLLLNTMRVSIGPGKKAVRVVQGAAAPLGGVPLSSTSKGVHGPDGLWFVGATLPPPDLSRVESNASGVDGFYCSIGRKHPGTKILALGPLTNVAMAIQACPDDMDNYSEIVVLGGSKYGGNASPVAEFNIWQDPLAAQIVFGFKPIVDPSRPPFVTVVPLHVFNQFELKKSDLKKIAAKGNAAAKLILPAIELYVAAGGEDAPIVLPDPVAAIYAVDRKLGESWPALIQVMEGPKPVRGQTIVGLTFNERLTMIADDAELSLLIDTLLFTDPVAFFVQLGIILSREPDNAGYVVDIHERTMTKLFVNGLTSRHSRVNARMLDDSAATDSSLLEEEDEQIHLPFVLAD